jgi:hypothetical protein
VKLSALCAGRPLPTDRFVLLSSLRSLAKSHNRSVAGRNGSIETSSAFIGNQTRDLPAPSRPLQSITRLLGIFTRIIQRKRMGEASWEICDYTQNNYGRVASSETIRPVALLRTDVSEERSASFIRVTRIGELGPLGLSSILRSVRRLLVTASVVPSSPILVALMTEALSSSETSVLTRAIQRNIP